MGTVIFCFVASFNSFWSRPVPSVIVKGWLIKCCKTRDAVFAERLGMKKMLRVSGMPGVGTNEASI